MAMILGDKVSLPVASPDSHVERSFGKRVILEDEAKTEVPITELTVNFSTIVKFADHDSFVVDLEKLIETYKTRIFTPPQAEPVKIPKGRKQPKKSDPVLVEPVTEEVKQ